VRLEQMAAVSRAVRLAHDHVRMQLRLAVVQSDVADQSQDLYLLVDRDAGVVFFSQSK
jgi:hypothetical protein